MSEYKRRRLPWVLIVVGGLLAAAALAMLLFWHSSVLQYTVPAPAAGDNGAEIRKLIEATQTLRDEADESLRKLATHGVKQIETLSVTDGGMSVNVTLYAVGDGWLEIYPRFLKQGRRISETELKQGERVAVLDENAAFQLFGSQLPDEAFVDIEGKRYRVAGTVRHAGSLLGGRGVADIQPCDAYIPLLAAAADGIQLDTMTLSALPVNASSAMETFEDAAGTTWQAGGTLISLSKENMRRTILPRLVLLVVGLYAMVGLFKRMTALCGVWAGRFRQALSQSYIGPLIPRLLGYIALGLLGYGALLLATWALMSFSVQPLYIFTEWVPENIVSLASIQKVFWNLTADAAKLSGCATRELRVLQFWGGVLRWGMITALLGAALLPKQGREK